MYEPKPWHHLNNQFLKLYKHSRFEQRLDFHFHQRNWLSNPVAAKKCFLCIMASMFSLSCTLVCSLIALRKCLYECEVLPMVIPVGELLGATVGDMEGEAGDVFNVKTPEHTRMQHKAHAHSTKNKSWSVHCLAECVANQHFIRCRRIINNRCQLARNVPSIELNTVFCIAQQCSGLCTSRVMGAWKIYKGSGVPGGIRVTLPSKHVF